MSTVARALQDGEPALLDPGLIASGDTLVRREPFAFMVAHAQLPAAAAGALDADFPRYAGAGFFPHVAAECGASINRLIEQAVSPPIANAIGAQLGIADLAAHPTLVTICRSLNKRHGTIHTDSKSKIVTALIYLNESWPDTDAGCLRFLKRIDDIDDLVVPQVRPLYGTLAAFARADNSFHGHLPFAGERRVIQIAWLTSEAEKARKAQRGRVTRTLKKLLGPLDRWFGSGRSRNAAHRD